MGTIVARKRKDGTTGYTVQILRKKDGVTIHREAKTFNSKREAQAWMRWRESELDSPDGLATLAHSTATLADAVDRYIKEKSDIGRTKTQVLAAIKNSTLAQKRCDAITSADIAGYARELLEGGRKPQTVGNYISHLAAIFKLALPAWGMPLNSEAMRQAQVALRNLGTTSKSEKRERRPTMDELDKLMRFFTDRKERSPASAPMAAIIAFGIYSTRRQEEIVRIKWADLDEPHSRILVRDMKHPGQKKGNDVWVELPPEAMAIVKAQPKTEDRIFPYTVDAVSSSFTRACKFLGIDDLHFHDLRHEGVSRLFEMGRTIPLAASVSGHRSWNSLQRYSHLRETGDRFANWNWLKNVAGKQDIPP